MPGIAVGGGGDAYAAGERTRQVVAVGKTQAIGSMLSFVKSSQGRGQRGIDCGLRAANDLGLPRRGAHRRGKGVRVRVRRQGERFCEQTADGRCRDADDLEVHVVVFDRAGVVLWQLNRTYAGIR